jgi:hypothetical protein
MSNRFGREAGFVIEGRGTAVQQQCCPHCAVVDVNWPLGE